MNIRKADIPFDICKMLTLPLGLASKKRIKFKAYKEKVKVTEKKAKNRKGKKGKAKEIIFNDIFSRLTIKLTFFDSISIFRNLVSFDIFRDVHHGLIIFINELIKLF